MESFQVKIDHFTETGSGAARKESIIMKSAIGGDFGAKFTFTIGSTYLGFGALGLLSGMLFAKKPAFRIPTRRMYFSYYLNNMSHTTFNYANNASAAAMIYCLMGWGLTLGFENEMALLTPYQTNLMVGFLTGGIYKSTLGFGPAMVGALSGLVLAGVINLFIDELRERDYVSFEMRFN